MNLELLGEVIYLISRLTLNLSQNWQYLENNFDQNCNKKVHDKQDKYLVGQNS
jgi:hypothetical protein